LKEEVAYHTTPNRMSRQAKQGKNKKAPKHDVFMKPYQVLFDKRLEQCLQYSNAWQSIHGMCMKLSYKELLIKTIKLQSELCKYGKDKRYCIMTKRQREDMNALLVSKNHWDLILPKILMISSTSHGMINIKTLYSNTKQQWESITASYTDKEEQFYISSDTWREDYSKAAKIMYTVAISYPGCSKKRVKLMVRDLIHQHVRNKQSTIGVPNIIITAVRKYRGLVKLAVLKTRPLETFFEDHFRCLGSVQYVLYVCSVL
jgi:hypothetical protein